MKGMRIYIARDKIAHSCNGSLNEFQNVDELTLVRCVNDRGAVGIPPSVPDIFSVKPDAPACELVLRWIAGKPCHFIRPYNSTRMYMAGGGYGSSGDSRVTALFGLYGAVPIHDRCEQRTSN